jgi:hypothetical protein
LILDSTIGAASFPKSELGWESLTQARYAPFVKGGYALHIQAHLSALQFYQLANGFHPVVGADRYQLAAISGFTPGSNNTAIIIMHKPEY